MALKIIIGILDDCKLFQIQSAIVISKVSQKRIKMESSAQVMAKIFKQADSAQKLKHALGQQKKIRLVMDFHSIKNIKCVLTLIGKVIICNS